MLILCCRVEKLPDESLGWAQNLVSLNLNLGLDASATTLPKYYELQQFSQRLMSSNLACVLAYRSQELKTRKPKSSNLTTEEVHLESFNVETTDVVLQISVYSADRHNSLRYEFEMLGSHEIKTALSSLGCNTSISKSLRELSSLNFACPESLFDFRRLFNFSEDVLEQVPSDIIVHLGQHFYGVNFSNDVLENHSVLPLDGLRWTDNGVQIRLFEPYAFCHDGFCQHFLVIKQLRLANQLDLERLQTIHVKLVSKLKDRRKPCRICEQFNASIITVDDRLAPDNPCLFCQTCFEALHFDEKGFLIFTDFKVYPLTSFV